MEERVMQLLKCLMKFYGNVLIIYVKKTNKNSNYRVFKNYVSEMERQIEGTLICRYRIGICVRKCSVETVDGAFEFGR